MQAVIHFDKKDQHKAIEIATVIGYETNIMARLSSTR